MKTTWWTAGSGRIELRIGIADAKACHHPGPCDADVEILRRKPYIAKQLSKLDPDTLRGELREYGAWDDDELADHDANLQRVLCIACGDITEENA